MTAQTLKGQQRLTYHLQPDDVYAKSLIRSEAAQLYERTMATTTGHADETPFIRPKHESLGSKSSSASELAGLPNLYRPDAQSTMTPMQRFKVLSSANDPSPWESRQAMRDAGLTEGSLETLKARVKAAVSLDADKAVLKSSSATST